MSFNTKLNMIKYFKSIGIVNGENTTGKLLTITKKEVYKGIGMDKPTKQFNSAWAQLGKDRFGTFMTYDKELKSWIWL